MVASPTGKLASPVKADQKPQYTPCLKVLPLLVLRPTSSLSFLSQLERHLPPRTRATVAALSSDPCVTPRTQPEGCLCLSPLLNQEPSHAIGMAQTHSETQLIANTYQTPGLTVNKTDKALNYRNPNPRRRRRQCMC